MSDATVERGAYFSPSRVYRYALWRRWDTEIAVRRTLVVIGLNPSTADEEHDDPTIRRCVGFARRDGYNSLTMLNLFAFRSTDPAGLWAHPQPIGPETDTVIRAHAETAVAVLAAWGAFEKAGWRVSEVCELLQGKPIYCLGRTAGGHPRHPLYLRADAPLELWR